mmetsp:Transcript_37359/g.83604  ORF Transcript_37359/g.83604 Transcript_37359/m.83604 type:complete len:257 (+) Transcript_37359:55-825(+)
MFQETDFLLGDSPAAWIYAATLALIGSTFVWGFPKVSKHLSALLKDEKRDLKFPHSEAPWGMQDKISFGGWCVATDVRKSGIPGAGNARYVLEDIHKGSCVRRTKLLAAEDGMNEKIPRGSTTMCSKASDLRIFTNYGDAGAEISTNDQVVNFGGTPYNVPSDNQTIFIWTPANMFNHKTNEANVIIELDPRDLGHVRVVALRDIKAGEELFQDYRSFTNPEWFKSWCKIATGGRKMDTETLGWAISPSDFPFLKP